MTASSAGRGAEMNVYLDNGATTKADDAVVREMSTALSVDYGNPSSLHVLGRNASEIIDKARSAIAKELNCAPDEIIFTSGGTEANNLALNILSQGDHLITSVIEHPSVLGKAGELEKKGVKVTYLKVDNKGFISPGELKKAINDKTRLVSIMHANNEIGVVQNITEIGDICRAKNVFFHSDCVQSFKKELIDVNKMNLSMASLSAHKIHGPKGAGALFVRKGVRINPLFFGGAQESKRRSGSENVPGIAGFGKAVSLKFDSEKIRVLRDYFIARVEKEIENVKLNGSREKRLCNNVNFSFAGIEGESLLMHLDLNGICVSTGSACSSRSLEPSHVLMALGLKHEVAHGSIRFTLSKYTSKEELDYVVVKLKEAVKRLREVSALR
jgi:cysteine desulfurase